MIRRLVACALVAAWLAAVPAHAQSDEVCRVFESAYTAAMEAEAPVYPVDIAPNGRQHQIRLSQFYPPYVEKLPLSAAEFTDLKAHDSAIDESFLPECAWRGTERERVEGKMRMRVSFTRPIFSGDRRIALTQVSFRSSGIWAHGVLCVARRRGAGWRSTCQGSWIT